MSIVIENNENVDFIFKSIFGTPYKELLDLDPIIAGGFVVSCWHCSLTMNNSIIKSNFENYFDHKRKSTTQTMGAYRYLSENFSDIDIWIKEEYKVPDEYSFILNDQLNKEQTSFPFSFKNTFKVPNYNTRYDFYKCSKWANTFRAFSSESSNGNILQFMKKRYRDVGSLLSEFDFENCKFAYANGRLYYSEGAIEAFRKKELVLSDNRFFETNTIAGKVFSSLRAFKYAKRYGLSFDKKLSNYIFDIMFYACNLTSEEYSVKEKERVLNNFYAKEYCTPDVFFSMVDQLMRNLELFSVMKNYNPVWTGYFINNKNSLKAIKPTIF